MYFKSYLYLSIIFCLAIITANGQEHVPNNLPQVVPASPQSSSIAKYINFPVGPGTGIPDISIPLYEIVVGDIVVPITLSYHSSGFKVYDDITWAGSGWTLSAEPSITRSIQGVADDDSNGYLYNQRPSNPNYSFYYLDGLEIGNYDEEPDEFYYKLTDQSGKFYFSKPLESSGGYQILTQPYKPLKINYLGETMFNITDEKGLLYRFGKALDNTEFTERSTAKNVHNRVTTWKGTEIISSSRKDTVSFRYHPYHPKIYGSLPDHVSVEDSISAPFLEVNEYTGCPDGVYLPLVRELKNGIGSIYAMNIDGELIPMHCGFYSPTGSSLSVRVIDLKDIHFPGGKVTFQKSLTQLESIKVYQGNSVIKEFKFYQGSFPVAGLTPRPKLDSIHIINEVQEMEERYSFTYNIESGDEFPARIQGRDTDFWGYYIGPQLDSYTNTVPFTHLSSPNQYHPPFSRSRIYFTIGGTDKKSNPFYAKKGILSSITYPTGGTTFFEYEGNRYMEGLTIKDGPGIRVKSISHYDPSSGHTLKKAYRYGKGENGAGYIKQQVTQDSYMTEHLNYYYYPFTPYLDFITRIRTLSSNMLDDLFYSSSGSPVVYDEVSEYEQNGTEDAGKTVYRFYQRNYEAYGPFRIPGTTLTFDPKTEWRTGMLLSKEIYKRIGNDYELVQRNGYSYNNTAINAGEIPVGKVYRRIQPIISSTNTHQFSDKDFVYYEYRILTGAIVVTSDTTSLFEDGQLFKTINDYTYNIDNLLPVSIFTTKSDGTILQTHRSYPHNASVIGSAAETGRQKLLQDWRIHTLLKETNVQNGTVSSIRTDYNLINGLAHPVAEYLTLGTNAEQNLVRYNSYDIRGNVTSVSKDDGLEIYYLWDYEGQYPIAKVQNSIVSDVAYTSFEADGKGNWSYSGLPVTDPTAPTGNRVYKLNNGTITKNGLSSTKVYMLTCWSKGAVPPVVNGGTATLSVLRNHNGWTLYRYKIENATTVTLTGSAAIDELRLHPINAHMSTYTYEPLMGLSSQTDESGRTVYYDYDDFQRLKNIKNPEGNILENYIYHYKR